MAPVIGILNKLFTRREKRTAYLILLLSIVISIIETVGVSALMLFVSVATNFSFIAQNKFFSYWYNALGFAQPSLFVITLGILLIFFYGLRATLNIYHIYFLNMFAQTCQHRFASTLFSRYLLFNFKDFSLQSSSTINYNLFSAPSSATQVIAGSLNILAEGFTVLAIYAMLFYVNWKMTAVLSVLLSIKIFIVAKAFSGRISRAGKRSQEFMIKMHRAFNESFGNYKFLKLLSSNKLIAEQFRKINYDYARANNINAVWQGSPRFILETIGFSILIGVIVYVLFLYNNAQSVIPVVSMYALAFYRFLPSINKILMSYNQIMFNRNALPPLYDYLHKPIEHLGNMTISFQKDISLSHVSFGYDPLKPIIRDVTISLTKGEKIGFIGESGAGKTTLVDILVGLLKPDQGSLFIDGEPVSDENCRTWRQYIGYIPQQIYLFDGTVADNILCGRAHNDQKLISVLNQTNMYSFLMSKDGVNTRVGEAGIQLSGGQKQRLAIARALYDDPAVLVLDEATSSLDNENEELIMNEIYDSSANKTLLIIAHRLSTIARCDRVYRIENGLVTEAPTITSTHHFSATQKAQI